MSEHPTVLPDDSPYTPEQRRVAKYLHELTGIGAGEDPIGFLMASHNALVVERKEQPDADLEHHGRSCREVHGHSLGLSHTSWQQAEQYFAERKALASDLIDIASRPIFGGFDDPDQPAMALERAAQILRSAEQPKERTRAVAWDEPMDGLNDGELADNLDAFVRLINEERVFIEADTRIVGIMCRSIAEAASRLHLSDPIENATEQAECRAFDSDEKMNEIRAILANFGTAPAGNQNEYAAWIGMEELLTRIREVLP